MLIKADIGETQMILLSTKKKKAFLFGNNLKLRNHKKDTRMVVPFTQISPVINILSHL